jgi:uncharacterized protein YjiS (DUF1127 family)
MTSCDEIEFGIFDGRKLTAEEWESFKRCAQDARAQAMRELLGGVLASLRQAVLGGSHIIRACGLWAAAAVVKRWHAHALRRERRAAIRQLRALDDRMLRDIGLGRSEIESVIHDPERLMTRGLAFSRRYECVARERTSARSQQRVKPPIAPLIDKSAA